jgi:hypothetical protein
MKNQKKILILCIASIILSSCSIEKRVHNKGYFVQWNNSKSLLKKDKNISETSAGNEIEKPNNSDENEQFNIVRSTNTDVVSNESLEAEVNYENIDINKTSEASILKNNSKNTLQNKKNEEIKKNLKKRESKTKKMVSDAGDGGHSQLIALILCLLVGVIGIHRFYLGHIGIGIIQLLTLGGCGIWTLIDLILIITGSLKPKDGEYTDKL